MINTFWLLTIKVKLGSTVEPGKKKRASKHSTETVKKLEQTSNQGSKQARKIR
jgi:hypothetical protein